MVHRPPTPASHATPTNLFLLPFAAKIVFFFGLRTYLIATSFLFIFLMINKTTKKKTTNNKNRLWTRNVYFSPSPKDTFFSCMRWKFCAWAFIGRRAPEGRSLLLHLARKSSSGARHRRTRRTFFYITKCRPNESAQHHIHWCIIFRPLIKFQCTRSLSTYFIDIISQTENIYYSLIIIIYGYQPSLSPKKIAKYSIHLFLSALMLCTQNHRLMEPEI